MKNGDQMLQPDLDVQQFVWLMSYVNSQMRASLFQNKDNSLMNPDLWLMSIRWYQINIEDSIFQRETFIQHKK